MSVPSVQEFRLAFPQFTEALFPNARVSFWLGMADRQLSEERWDDLYAEGCCLYVAHMLTLEAAATKAQDGSGGMDAAAGPVLGRTKTVGSVSLSENRAGAAATGYLGAGQYNDTVYGKQYWQLLLIVGAGGLHV